MVSRPGGPPLPLRAITFDYWDTLYSGANLRERAPVHRAAVGRLFAAHGRTLDEAALAEVYAAGGRESERWWREEHRGYTTAQRIRWMLAQHDISPPEQCAHVARCVADVNAALLEVPPPLIEGAAEGIRRLAARVPLAIVSDTGFASGDAQNDVLVRDGLRDCFAATIYSSDVGHAKPHRAMFAAATEALGVDPAHALHVGDNERTDVAGALAFGMRAARVDFVAPGRESRAELVTGDFDALVRYLLTRVDRIAP